MTKDIYSTGLEWSAHRKEKWLGDGIILVLISYPWLVTSLLTLVSMTNLRGSFSGD